MASRKTQGGTARHQIAADANRLQLLRADRQQGHVVTGGVDVAATGAACSVATLFTENFDGYDEASSRPTTMECRCLRRGSRGRQTAGPEQRAHANSVQMATAASRPQAVEAAEATGSTPRTRPGQINISHTFTDDDCCSRRQDIGVVASTSPRRTWTTAASTTRRIRTHRSNSGSTA